jgi:pimeloyl-ACP methyl ester carboxylesterase
MRPVETSVNAHSWCFTWLLGIILLLTACGQSVSRFEDTSQETIPPDRVPIVIVPGISREVARQLNGSIIPYASLSLRIDGEALAHLGDPRFPVDGDQPLGVPGELDKALRGTDVRGVQALINHLIQQEGYIRGDPEQPRDKNYPENPEGVRTDRKRLASLFVVYYDWRRDVTESACILAERVARIRASTGVSRVHLVGHSLGGVVVRYYLRYGGRDAMRDRDCPLGAGEIRPVLNAPGSGSAGRVVTLGAPYRGSELAFRALLQDVNVFGFVSLGLQRAIFTMPVVWELLPFAGEDGRVPLLVNQHGEEQVSLYDAQTWIERGWIVGDSKDPERQRFIKTILARASALHRRLAEPDPMEEVVPRLIVGSGCRPTPARAIVVDGKIEFLSRTDTDNPLFDRITVPGDGIVSLESSLGISPAPTLTPVTVCSAHTTYVNDPGTTERIAQFLLR